jgi:hypothetical protein
MWFGCGGYVVGKNKAKLSPSKAGARAELGKTHKFSSAIFWKP